MSIDKNTPILVAAGIVQQRLDDPAAAKEPVQLMLDAAHAAGEDSGSNDLLRRVESIQVSKGFWEYSNPARLIAAGIGAPGAETVLADLGILQHTLMADACKSIQAGEKNIIMVAGGEARFRSMLAKKQGIEIESTPQTDDQPDTFLQPEAEITSAIEIKHKLYLPVENYAMMDNAMRFADGQSIASHQQQLAVLYARFSQIAAENPDAWLQQQFTPEEIMGPGPDNRMLAFPYTKLHATQWNVDQASALIYCSVAVAEELNIPRGKWVFPLVHTDVSHMTIFSEREALHRSAGAALAGGAALELAGCKTEDIELFDLYSCFPAAVKIYARELGIPLERELTVTGGMSFAGGPLNNYVMQATAKMAQRLRLHPGAKGLISSVSGFITKQGFAVMSTESNPDGFQYADLSSAAAAEVQTKELTDDFTGAGKIASYTVRYAGAAPSELVAVCDTSDGRRQIASSHDPAIAEQATQQEFCDREVKIGPDAQLAFG